MRIALLIVLLIHGLIHGLGVVKAFALAPVPQLAAPISRPLGVLWLIAGLLLVAAALTPWRWFWLVAGAGAILSQVAIVTAWADARFGTAANVIALGAAVWALGAHGPLSLPAAYAADAARLLATAAPPGAPITEADLALLPAPIARYVRAAGVVGQPVPASVRARWTGRIRADAGGPWMPLTAVQVNTLGARADRLFLIAATMNHLPVDTYHRFVGDHATFRVRAAGVATVVDGRGPEMDRAETVTVLNDLCLLAPAAVVALSRAPAGSPALAWTPIDDRHARVTYTRGAIAVSATLEVDDRGALVDFVSDDRLRASRDGATFTPMRWSTPVAAPRAFGPVTLAARGEARWHPADAPAFAYAELALVDVVYDVADPGAAP